jgi:group II intron reverse transcriptase/maturase
MPLSAGCGAGIHRQFIPMPREVQAEWRNNRDGQGENTHAPCQLPVPAGHTNPTRPTETDKGDNREGQGCNPHASSSLPIPTKHINPLRAVQAERRNERDGQPGNTQGTLSPRKEEETAEEYVPQDGQQDTTQIRSFWNGGSDCSASEPKRKPLKHRVYDPLLGKHIIPVINDSNLLDRIVDEDNFLQAIDFIASEPKKSCGYDNKSVKEVCDSLATPEAREKIRQQLLRGEFRPDKVRISLIRKPNGKMRPLGIATVLDRIVQRMILQVVINNLPENPWSPYSYAYQAGRNIGDAIEEVNRIREEGYTHAIKIDLTSFFDNVPHDRLMKKLRIHIPDKRVVGLINAFLTTLVIGPDGSVSRNRKGTLQGSPISPWLASMLYLDELDQEMARRGHRYVRFADDITVFTKSKKATGRRKARLITFIENTMGCPVNMNKTEVQEIEHLKLYGVEWANNTWRIQRDKAQEARAIYLGYLDDYTKKKDDYWLWKAARQMRGFITHFDIIPDFNRRQIRALKRWCLNRWWHTGERRTLFEQKWLVTDKPRYINPVSAN